MDLVVYLPLRDNQRNQRKYSYLPSFGRAIAVVTSFGNGYHCIT